jgi:hypothetical protein
MSTGNQAPIGTASAERPMQPGTAKGGAHCVQRLVRPTDFEIKSLLHSFNRAGQNMELRNISLCMASRQRTEWTIEYEKSIHTQLKRMVREEEIRRRVFLPGKPYYCPA